MKKVTFLIYLFLCCTTLLSAQEICDNGIDDDGDGLVDLNDTEDCICTSFIGSSLIPNPSFEDMTCCPNANEMLNCAVDWQQASAATSDYVHTCEDFLGNTSIPAFAPLPFPDGEGAVGFRDGQEMVGTNYKEYVGACLTEAMEVGVTYKLDFFVGFQNNVTGSMNLDLAFFGSTDCTNLPFGDSQDFNIGCPLNAGGYSQLTQINVSGSNEWINVQVEFVADQPYRVLVLGPTCSGNSNYLFNPYFYVDRLFLEEEGAFGVPFDEVSGSICEDDLVLSINDAPGNTYQWYLDGIALSGETDSSIALDSSSPDGTYQVVISNSDACILSRTYEVVQPPYYTPLAASICEDESFLVGNTEFDSSGYYEVSLLASDGCDSIVQLELEVNPNTYGFVRDTFCEGEVYSFFDLEFDDAGNYEVTVPSTTGCDSIVSLELSVISTTGGIVMETPVTLALGDVIDLGPDYVAPEFVQFTWLDEAGSLIGENIRLENYQAVDNTRLSLEAFNIYGCSEIISLEILVDKSNIKMYIPNAFSPDSDGINDFFKFYSTQALAGVEVFAIYDRWGEEVYRAEDIAVPTTLFNGWDGTFKGEPAAVGVYAYYLQATFLDGSQWLFEGDVTLLR